MPQKGKGRYCFGDFDLKVDSRLLVRGEERVPLGSKAFEVLVQLVIRAGEVVPKDELLQAVWPGSFVEERNLTQQISSLRKALGDEAGCITTVPGRGYQFTANVVEIPHETPQETSLKTLDASMVRPPDASIMSSPTTSGEVMQSGEVVHTLHQRTEVTFEESAYLTFPAQRERSPWRFLYYALGAGALLAAGALLGWRLSRHAVPVDHRQVVLADFINTTSDATFGQTLNRALAIDLEQSPFIEVLSDRGVMQTLQLMERKSATAMTPDVAREVCERANRQVLLTGNVTAVGSKYLLTLEAVDCSSGKRLASAKAEARSREDVLGALDSVAERVRRGLGESAQSVESYHVPIAQATTTSLEALKMFSIGSYLTTQGKDENETIPFFQKAIELDPQFAMAYSGLAGRYYNLEEFELASENDAKAFALSEHVSARERLIIQAHYYGEGQNDLKQGIATYKMWSETYPHDYIPFANLCNMYAALGQYDLAIEAGRKALELEKDHGQAYAMLAYALMHANRYAEALAVGEQAKQHHVDAGPLHATLFDIAVAQKNQGAIAQEREWAQHNRSSWYDWYFPLNEASAAASAGRYQEARELFVKSADAAKSEQNQDALNGILAEEANTEQVFGLTSAARETLRRIRYDQRIPADDAFVSAELGDTGPAERYLREYAKPIADTEITYLYLPRVRAALAMQRNKPQESVDALEMSRPYELTSYDVPIARAAAYLKLGQPAKAAQEYQKILDHPGIDPTEFWYPLAHLGLARAYAQAGNLAGSRAEYNTFLQLWKDADPDLPVLKAAKAELEKLPG